MFDIDEIMRRAQEASERASRQLNENIEKGKEIAARAHDGADKAAAQDETEQQQPNDGGRRVEIGGRVFGPATAGMATDEDAIKRIVDEKVAEAAALGIEGLMGNLFGEDMGVLAAALETLAAENGEEDDERDLDLALEQELYDVLDEKMALLDKLPEPEPIVYARDDPRWARFGILLSGIVSKLNDHRLDGLDVEEHIPVMEQQIVSLVRRSWGINGRGELLDTLGYLTREGYYLRYGTYCEAQSPGELCDDPDDGDELASAGRGWRFAQHYKARYTRGFLTGWDVGRAVMLARWGSYLGWLTAGEASGILLDLARRAAEELRSWREFARSYLFGGLMWKLICGDGAAESYLGFLADAAADLLTGKAEDNEGQWYDCPWPAARRIGFLS